MAQGQDARNSLILTVRRPYCSDKPIRRRCHTMPVKACYRIVGELSCCGLVGWSDGTDCVTLHAPTGGLSLALYELATG